MKIEPPDRLGDMEVMLRPMRREDATHYAAAFRQDHDLARLLGIEEDPDERTVLETVRRQAQLAEEGKGVELTIADPRTQQFWGALLVHQLSWHHRRCEIGFWLSPDHRRRGIGTRAVSLALAWLFNELDLVRVEMNTTPENRSLPSLARRLGFTQEGIQRSRNLERGQRVDVVWFGLLREEWRPRTHCPPTGSAPERVDG